MAKGMKLDKEKLVFKDSWTDLYFFVEQKEVSNESVSVNKEYNLKLHHVTKHKGYNEYKPSERKKTLLNLEN